jgi:hypothetical protein
VRVGATEWTGEGRTATGAVRHRRVDASVFVSVVVAVAAFALTSCAGDDGTDAPATTVASTTSDAPVPTSTSAGPVTTATSTSTTAPGAVPAVVTVVSAGAGGGSGEIELIWEAVDGAVGYRVARAASSGGPFTTSADVDVAGGSATVASGVTNVYSELRSYFPPSATTTGGAEEEARFHYIEVVAARTYLRVTAYNAAGEAPSSPTVCAAPTGVNDC